MNDNSLWHPIQDKNKQLLTELIGLQDSNSRRNISRLTVDVRLWRSWGSRGWWSGVSAVAIRPLNGRHQGTTSTTGIKGTNPSLKKPSNIPDIYVKIRGLHRPDIATDGYIPWLSGRTGWEKYIEPGYGHGHGYKISKIIFPILSSKCLIFLISYS